MASEQTFSGDTVVVVSSGQLSCDLEGEKVILDLKNGAYYGLDPVGSRILSLLQEPRQVSQVRDALLEEYDVEPERCEQDVIALLGELAAHGLVEVRHGSPA